MINDDASMIEAMPINERARYLNSLAFHLTVVARNTYVPAENAVERPVALRGVVEISHRVLSRVLTLQRGEDIVSADSFLTMLFGLAQIYDCVFELENALAFSAESYLKS
ncbi:hypothetical protein [Duganella radicis]|uniref:Uncharacterized protein n=1 Tax=Duganella radicis TaxID=551988 RepID=A0A6L6PEV0_9BURK|nr:hypothetical protein [Duganella radicis]MTV37560.1 hypothetical protein [Duganella radicis]